MSEAAKTINPEDFAAYDRCLDEGRRAYLAGLGRDANLYPPGTDRWEWWREGYDQTTPWRPADVCPAGLTG